MPISYTRSFSHTDWVDNVDRVQAGGDSGFNGRFHAIEADLDTISSTFGAVQQALNALSQKPPPSDVKLTLAPTLTTIVDPWEQVAGGVRKPAGATAANGMMNVDLPQGTTLTSFRVIGENSGAGVLVVGFRRQALAVGAASQLIISAGGSGGGFDTTNAVPPGQTVDNAQFRYFILATLSAAAAGDTVTLEAFQITHQPS